MTALLARWTEKLAGGSQAGTSDSPHYQGSWEWVDNNLSQVDDSFMCRRCDGTIQEVDLAEDLMVDGEMYEYVKSFCYLGDTLDGDGGADLAAT